ncbi:iron-sulfur cluster carrier protein ApbC [Aquicella lusitana]|uniref:Iron-sulfur cluster carrier protein n=1 Tax=Aquicella lusitana TaxID=254246 RepID=A0A370GD05_9COXI|nr:iron-sulfur cluster carrier protein ApbC [Aquicella lusitana]RDI39853.1 ATP-binding protein involved in chromosome partitioning [Aquicella lusitana]VVC73126.1 Flagellum site-determining protein YlxH [Aquicella lusitana]
MLQKEIEARLARYQDPYLGKDLVSAKAIKRITVNGGGVEIEISLGYPFEGRKARMIAEIETLLAPLVEGKTLAVRLSSQIDAHNGRQGVSGLANVKNIIAVGSGKGGVGKSTIAVNLALALAHEGARVGILDADIYGPSQPAMLGSSGERPVLKEKSLLPIIRYGLQSMSIGYLIDEDAPMVWRGPMIGKAMQQLLHDTAWDALDYLIVDLPPGTGDIQLTLCQKMPVSGAVIVTTPQDLALLDVRRACEMFNKLNVPIIGVIENMSHYHCPHCGHDEPVFGQGGGAKLAEQYQLALLGSIPLDIRLREMTDSGNPPVTQEPEGQHTGTFCEIARKVAAILALQARDYSARFPKVVVQHTSPGQVKTEE